MNRKEGGRRKEKSTLQVRKLSLFCSREEARFNATKQSSAQRRLKGEAGCSS